MHPSDVIPPVPCTRDPFTYEGSSSSLYEKSTSESYVEDIDELESSSEFEFNSIGFDSDNDEPFQQYEIGYFNLEEGERLYDTSEVSISEGL